jgi:hypothetical protein
MLSTSFKRVEAQEEAYVREGMQENKRATRGSGSFAAFDSNLDGRIEPEC